MQRRSARELSQPIRDKRTLANQTHPSTTGCPPPSSTPSTTLSDPSLSLSPLPKSLSLSLSIRPASRGDGGGGCLTAASVTGRQGRVGFAVALFSRRIRRRGAVRAADLVVPPPSPSSSLPKSLSLSLSPFGRRHRAAGEGVARRRGIVEVEAAVGLGSGGIEADPAAVVLTGHFKDDDGNLKCHYAADGIDNIVGKINFDL
uniref:Uncharacterized protein n=1 Tax=Oryza meridionalis TaxID=40149 RepID=A0A0E0D5Q3_9ORYZ